MEIVLVTGGARSGKSRWARDEARALGGDRVTMVATATAADEEMARRIRRHREGRPQGWTTLEEPLDVARALREAPDEVVVLDCLTLLVANVMLAAEPREEPVLLAAARRATEELLKVAEDRDGTLIVVTNEVGTGIVPPTPLGRWFRDAQGLANQLVGAAARQVVLLVSGQPLRIK